MWELWQASARFWSRVWLANTIWLVTVFELDEDKEETE